MQNRQSNEIKMLSVAAALSSVLLCSCASTRAEKSDADKNPQPKQDSEDVFVPTHPPVLIDKTWREVMNDDE